MTLMQMIISREWTFWWYNSNQKTERCGVQTASWCLTEAAKFSLCSLWGSSLRATAGLSTTLAAYERRDDVPTSAAGFLSPSCSPDYYASNAMTFFFQQNNESLHFDLAGDYVLFYSSLSYIQIYAKTYTQIRLWLSEHKTGYN